MDASPAAGAAFDWLSAIPWGVAICGTAINLAWNYSNYRMTTGLQRKIRSETIALEEFRRVRIPIDAALGELVNQKASLASLSASSVAIDEWRKQIGDAQVTIVEAYERLDSALSRADASRFAQGEDWRKPIEIIWDDFSTAINGAYNPIKKDVEARAVPAAAAEKLQEIITAVERRIDRELAAYAL